MKARSVLRCRVKHDEMIVLRFPAPPAVIQEVLSTLVTLRGSDKAAIDKLGDTTALCRPWIASTVPAEFRKDLWKWCDEVAGWLNGGYAWRPVNLIPNCWPEHPHLAHELPVLACLRAAAEDAHGPELLEDWHRHALPKFFERLAVRLGESSCRTGQHQDWPAASRYAAYTSKQAAADRGERFDRDTTPRGNFTVGPDDRAELRPPAEGAARC